MGKQTDSLPTTTAPSELPSYIQTASVGLGLDDTKGYGSMPILKIVAGTSRAELQDEYGVGSIICDNVLLAKEGDPVMVRPILFFPSWQKRKDKDDKSEGNFIVEEVFDREHIVAKRAMARQDEEYFEGSPYAYRHVDSYNFILQILEGEMKGQIVVVKMSLGNAQEAKSLNSYLQRRKIDIFLNQMEMRSVRKTNGKEVWRVFSFQRPEDMIDSYTPEREIDEARDLYEAFAKLHAGDIKTRGEDD